MSTEVRSLNSSIATIASTPGGSVCLKFCNFRRILDQTSFFLDAGVFKSV